MSRHPDLFDYGPTARGTKTFVFRWGEGPAERFKKATNHAFMADSMMHALGSETLVTQVDYSTQLDKWKTAPLRLLLDALGVKFVWPVKGKLLSNSLLTLPQGDGAAWLVFLGKDGPTWHPVHLYCAWTQGKILFHRWCLDRDNVALIPRVCWRTMDQHKLLARQLLD